MQSLIAAQGSSTHLTYTHILVKACADLLAEKPEYHRFVTRDRRLRPAAVDIGLSVAADHSLAASDLHARRKAGGTFQITNLPSADLFVPLLLGGVSALGLGRVSELAVADHGQVVVREMVRLGFGVDHAVFDGRRAASFRSEVKSALEVCDTTMSFIRNA